MKVVYKLLFLLLLGTGIAISQTSPSQSTPDQSQQSPAAASPQSQYPSTTGQAGAGASGAAMSSKDVKTAIQTAFQQDQSLASSGIKVNVSDDKVTLSGTASSADKDKANQIVAANAGGRQVEDKIKVSDSNSATPKQ